MSPIPCPSCGAALPPSPASCPACGIALTGPDAARLWQVDQELARLTAERRVLLASLRAQPAADTADGCRRAPPPSRSPPPHHVPSAPRTRWPRDVRPARRPGTAPPDLDHPADTAGGGRPARPRRVGHRPGDRVVRHRSLRPDGGDGRPDRHGCGGLPRPLAPTPAQQRGGARRRRRWADAARRRGGPRLRLVRPRRRGRPRVHGGHRPPRGRGPRSPAPQRPPHRRLRAALPDLRLDRVGRGRRDRERSRDLGRTRAPRGRPLHRCPPAPPRLAGPHAACRLRAGRGVERGRPAHGVRWRGRRRHRAGHDDRHRDTPASRCSSCSGLAGVGGAAAGRPSSHRAAGLARRRSRRLVAPLVLGRLASGRRAGVGHHAGVPRRRARPGPAPGGPRARPPSRSPSPPSGSPWCRCGRGAPACAGGGRTPRRSSRPRSWWPSPPVMAPSRPPWSPC